MNFLNRLLAALTILALGGTLLFASVRSVNRARQQLRSARVNCPGAVKASGVPPD